jgi:hypothetical protein
VQPKAQRNREFATTDFTDDTDLQKGKGYLRGRSGRSVYSVPQPDEVKFFTLVPQSVSSVSSVRDPSVVLRKMRLSFARGAFPLGEIVREWLAARMST